jgi:uncharacterized membrane protein YhiD involved in acid resistance
MNPFPTFQEFLTTQSVHIPLFNFIVNLILAMLLSYLLSIIYVKYGQSLSNRKMFGQNFILITMTTMLIISIVKSSLALSLGLVGALSIVRFRAAIKEPEELAYLFLAIAIGLGMGADQRVITMVAFAIIIGIIWLMKFSRKSEANQNLHLIVSSHNPGKVELAEIIRVLKTHCATVNLRRFDDSRELLEATFAVEFEDFSKLEAAKSALQKLGDTVKISFLDNKVLGGI